MTFHYDEDGDLFETVSYGQPSTGTISGTLNFGQPWTDQILGAQPQDRAMEIQPCGARFPWYPIFTGRADFTESNWSDEDGTRYEISYRWTDGPHRGRVGWRRSAKWWWRRVRGERGLAE